MRATTQYALLGALLATTASAAPKVVKKDVDTRFPYTGPTVPIGDWVGNTINGNGKGFPRLIEPPAVTPSSSKPSNNVNVIALSYIPQGVNIHFQTPFGIGAAPSIKWGASKNELSSTATGKTTTYDRQPPCSAVSAVTQCSQFFHDVQIPNLKAGTTYYYQIPAANGTTESEVLSFTTARAAGDHASFTIAVLNDMGYTNAHGTFQQLNNVVNQGAAFAWHGGDISYADDWYSGILPCASDWPVCYNGSSTQLPGGPPYPAEYIDAPLPAGEIPNQGGPQGGDMSVLYESNWDLWQQWLNKLSMHVPYMVLPGNHEATCAEFDGPNNEMTAYLNDGKSNSTAPKSSLTYYSCPPSQRNFTAYQHRFRMPGSESGGVSNFWYSFDYGLAHFVSMDVETDFPNSPEYPFAREVTGNETLPKKNETYVTNSGPFGSVGNYSSVKTYQQYQWLQADLAKVNRTATPWIIAMGHRPMYSSGVSGYQRNIRNAFEALLLQYGVDAYMAGHIHWYERLYPLGNSTIDSASIINNHTYQTNPGVSMTHIVNGQAGNIESHSELSSSQSVLNITAVLNTKNYGFTRVSFHNASVISMDFIEGDNGTIGDSVTIIKKPSAATSLASSSTKSSSATATGSAKSSSIATSTVSAKGSSAATSSASAKSSSAATSSASAKSSSAVTSSASAKSSSAVTSSASAKSSSAVTSSASAKSSSAVTSSASTKSSSAVTSSTSTKSSSAVTSSASTTSASVRSSSSAGAQSYSNYPQPTNSYGGWDQGPWGSQWGDEEGPGPVLSEWEPEQGQGWDSAGW